MTTRDRTVVMVLLVAGAVAAFWFGLLAPKRDSANRLAGEVDAAKVRLSTAQASVEAGLAAERGYAADYATVARLGKAVPVQDDVPSLVYQLQTAAKASRIGFDSLAVVGGGTAPAPAAPATPAAQAAQVGDAQKNGSGNAPAAAPAGAVPATQASVSVLPPGVVVGSAGFPTMPFDFSFHGSFFNLEGFFGRLAKFTSAGGKQIDVRGRLLTVDGIALSGFPKMTATVHATAYLLPDSQGLLAGASPQAPAGGTPASSGQSSTPAPAVATVTGVAR